MTDLTPEMLLFLKSISAISQKGKAINYKDVSLPKNEHGRGDVAESLERLCEAGYLYYELDEQGHKKYYTTEKGKTECQNQKHRPGRAGFRNGINYKI